MRRRAKGTIQGIVQGVGFRPFIYQLAVQHHLAGYVINNSKGVELEVEGSGDSIRRFFEAVVPQKPPLAHIASMEWSEIPPREDKAFEIRLSQSNEERTALISPDVSVCEDCLREAGNPSDRRYHYPFINCTNCGPRYTIIQDIPYDREYTTMKKFEMCPECRAEYEDPDDRRFHAQPNACWTCGPRASLYNAEAALLACEDPIVKAASLLKDGHVLAIKGLGGFHLAVDARNDRAVRRLRRRKHREEKPLALMVKDLDAACEIGHVCAREAEALGSYRRPIVLVKKRRRHGLSSQIAPRNKYFGIMLPYTPLHYRIMEEGFRALVMTSGNMTEEPITIDNDQAFQRLAGIADYFLTHDRDIYLRSDDSIVRLAGEEMRLIRRSRGYVPVPLFLSEGLRRLPSALAVGAELKNTVCLTKENRAFLSQHVGDMENLETLEFFRLTVDHLKRILEIRPVILAHDLHPDYLSSIYAREQTELPTLAVQHHHAHIVSCLAEHGVHGPVIGLALDGTGLGSDGTVWGGEALLADLSSFKRLAHLECVPLPGGDAAARDPWRMALAYLDAVYGDELFNLPIPFVKDLRPGEARVVLQMARKGINSPLTSSCGRLFDAVSAVLGIRKRTAYEGQAAVELEMSQNPREQGHYPWLVEDEADQRVLKTSVTFRAVVEDIRRGTPKGTISRRFHNTLVHSFTEVCDILRDDTGIAHVALSGGAFQNDTLLTGLTRALTERGFWVYSHRHVPSNDGGLALGQAVCAASRHAGFCGEAGDFVAGSPLRRKVSQGKTG